MKSRFRIVHYAPDPFLGMRVTVGALVEVDGVVQFIRAPHVPGPACVGGRPAWTTMQLVLDALAMESSFKAVTGEISQLTSISAPFDVPVEVENAVAWVTSTALPHTPPGNSDHRVQRERRSAVGLQLLKQWGVAEFVHSRFHVEKFVGKALPGAALKHTPAHWVLGAHDLLLMEPFIGSRPSLENDLKEVRESFLAHQRLFDIGHLTIRPSYFAYVAPRGYSGAVADVERGLRSTGASIVNTDDPDQRQPFLSRIRSVGMTGKVSGTLFDN